MTESIQPIVLVGGRSRRFGRDKLLEPVGQGVLVDRPIGALRAVFGPRVLVVGECDPRVAARADGALWDRYPGAGPIGGILSALEATGLAVFVLGGDLARMDADAVRLLLAEAARSPDAVAVVAESDRPEPCIGLYRPAAAGALSRAIVAGHNTLHIALESLPVHRVPLPAWVLTNVNTPADLPRP